jgi:hypothetical protein
MCSHHFSKIENKNTSKWQILHINTYCTNDIKHKVNIYLYIIHYNDVKIIVILPSKSGFFIFNQKSDDIFLCDDYFAYIHWANIIYILCLTFHLIVIFNYLEKNLTFSQKRRFSHYRL